MKTKRGSKYSPSLKLRAVSPDVSIGSSSHQKIAVQLQSLRTRQTMGEQNLVNARGSTVSHWHHSVSNSGLLDEAQTKEELRRVKEPVTTKTHYLRDADTRAEACFGKILNTNGVSRARPSWWF
jgi:hypothetical protein